MNGVSEARDLITIIAGPQTLGHSIKAALRDVARKTGLGDRRVRAIWNREARLIRSTEMDRLRQLSALEAARAEIREIDASIVRATNAMAIRPADAVRSVVSGEGEAHRVAHSPVDPAGE